MSSYVKLCHVMSGYVMSSYVKLSSCICLGQSLVRWVDLRMNYRHVMSGYVRLCYVKLCQVMSRYVRLCYVKLCQVVKLYMFRAISGTLG
jgi:hypothetical protein